jgi:hypothetical protein
VDRDITHDAVPRDAVTCDAITVNRDATTRCP